MRQIKAKLGPDCMKQLHSRLRGEKYRHREVLPSKRKLQEVKEQSKMLPGMASAAADGYSFALSRPTLMSMFPAGGQIDLNGEEGDAFFTGLMTSPERP